VRDARARALAFLKPASTGISGMLDHYQQTKNILVSYSTKALGFF
jgi:hypothetical protein